VRVRTVFFDFGGTLAEQILDPLDVWLELADALRLTKSREDLERALEAANAWFQTAVFEYYGRSAELWMEYDRRVLSALAVEDPARWTASAIQARFRNARWNRAYPEAQPVLEGLRDRGYALHVISNATDEIRDRIQNVGLEGYFESITCSQEAGANKPAPAPFLLALAKAGCVPGGAIHVGNTYEDDVLGARGVGIAPVLIDRDGVRPEAGCPRFRDLRGVLTLIP